jgi:hypothetical protein
MSSLAVLIVGQALMDAGGVGSRNAVPTTSRSALVSALRAAAAAAGGGGAAAQRNRQRGVQVQVADVFDFEVFLGDIRGGIDFGIDDCCIFDFVVHAYFLSRLMFRICFRHWMRRIHIIETHFRNQL